MGLLSHPDPNGRSTSPLLAAEEFYLAQYNATRRRSVDTGGLALALRDDGSLEKPSGKGWGGWDDPHHASIPYAEMLSRLYMQTMPSSALPSSTPPSHMTSSTRLQLIRKAGSWAFDPLSLSSDDLFETTCLIFSVLFTIEGASEDIGIQAHQLRPFLLAIRSVYSHDNTYHNYQHAVDVLQAMYAFLADAGCIPPVSILESSRALISPKWKRASAPVGTLKGILNNVDVFMLFVAAIGHDAGHPGLNNGFMKCAGTCLSAMFDHTSTLERMHCTLLLQLMRNYGLGHLIRSDNILFGDDVPQSSSSRNIRGALVDTVLATDMGLHFRWIKDFNDLIDERGPLDSTYGSQTEQGKKRVKILACQALMKCADISNPVRPHTISEAWSRALMNEWYAQATLERSLALPTSVPSNLPPPSRPSIFTAEDPGTSSYHQSHATSSSSSSTSCLSDEQLEGWDTTEITAAKEQVRVQVSFIDVFAAPLYAALARFSPELAHFYARCTQNRQLWEAKMGELTELEVELQRASTSSADADTTLGGDGIVDMDADAVCPEAGAPIVSSEHDTRSSIDSGPPLFSPGMMSDFSFGRRASTTTTSSFSSMPSNEDEPLVPVPVSVSVSASGVDSTTRSTPKAQHRDREKEPSVRGIMQQFPAGPSSSPSDSKPPSEEVDDNFDDEAPIPPPHFPMPVPLPSSSSSSSSRRAHTHTRNTSIASSVSVSATYYTARSRGSTPDPDAEWTSSRPVFGHEWRMPFSSSVSVSSSSSLSRARRAPPNSYPFAAHVGVGVGVGGALSARPVLPEPEQDNEHEPEYRTPLGIEVMRAAYRASARKQAGIQYGLGDEFADDGGGGGSGSGGKGRLSLIDREYPYRRRSAGNVNVNVGQSSRMRPLAVR